MIKLKKGLNLPITGEPSQVLHDGPRISRVALLGDDVVGMKPTMAVKVGDQVKTGQLLYTDKKTEGVLYTSPGSGEVVEINRGDKRKFLSVVIKLSGSDEHVAFNSFKGATVDSYNEQGVKDLLIESGMWPSLRRRPFSKAAVPTERPSAIFVNAMDTHPLAANPMLFIKEHQAAFLNGLKVLGKLTDKVHVCAAPDANLDVASAANATLNTFKGPHPAGLSGTHIHFLHPVGEKNFVWYTNYQDVIAIGKLFETGQLFLDRMVSVAGPAARNPRVVKTRMGASLEELTKDELFENTETRIISGSVFGGRKAQTGVEYLGRFHHQVSLLREGRDRELLGWHSPGFDRYSVKPIYVSKLFGNKKYDFTTNAHGSLRSIVPIGSYEKVMPLDILPTFLVRSLMSKNTDMSIKLGALELDEEDMALVTFVDPCKNDFATKLRENLTLIEKEGL
ncbi:MAG: NADH:ubiquinone reductase (Na(+)-transporting) subunit A [Halobacteriovoraceae bacterium]|nr:NADH:ubiquinone reductase (Na(+)-transporting) subunit A [Halobacteriovoraceae bacterium]|tara:strand:- start:201 stop:1550 length:1350 start_codon:yes stop_codon:yes gene_type:complete